MSKILTFLFTAFPFLLSLQSFAQPGAPDTKFGTDGWVKYNDGGSLEPAFRNMVIQPDGKIIVHKTGFLGRYNTDGTLDNSFGLNGWKRLDHGVIDMTIQADGTILLLAGSGATIYRHNASDGSLDLTWGDQGGVTIEVPAVTLRYNSITVDTKGRIIVAGQATFGTDPVVRTTSVARLNADGSLDLTFSGVGIKNQLFLDNVNRSARECGVDGNDKIVISVSVGGAEDRDDILMRYNPDGKLDLGFGGQGTGELVTNLDLDRLAVNVDGKIGYTSLLRTGGTLPEFLYYYRNADGSYINDGFIRNITGLSAITFQADGKLVVAGHNLSRLLVRRVNADGTSDQTFLNDDRDVDHNIIPKEIIYFNRRLFLAGFYPVLYLNFAPIDADGFILALDATDKRLKCNTFGAGDLQPNADAGKCYKTINDSRFDPAFIPSTATGTVDYQLLRNGVVVEQGTGTVNGKDFPVGATQIKYSYTDITTHSCTFTVTVLDKQLPVAKPKNITAQLNSSGTVSVITANVDDGSTDNCGIKSMTLSKTNFDCTNVGANTVTFTVTDNSNNTSTSTATVTVEDKIAPVVKCKNLRVALDADGNGSITANDMDDGSTDACGIKNLIVSKELFDCSNKGSNEVTLTATDNNNNTSACTATVTVVDEIAPSILTITPSPAFLWPSDRKMKAVTINASIWDNCPGATYRVTDVAIKSGIFANDNVNPDWEITGDHTVDLRAEIPKKGTRRIYTMTILCTDAAGNSTTGTVDVVVGHTITSPTTGVIVKVGSAVSLSGSYWDVPGKKHTAKWTIDENVTVNGSLTEPSGQNNGTVKGSYKFNTPGVYKIQMNVKDQNGNLTYANTSDNLEAIVVVYDPNGGYTYGGGCFNSPAGALVSDPTASGDASFGFTVNYYKNATLPKGETQFRFMVADFEFNALNFDYLVISNSMAQFKGTGKIIGGQSGIGFTMTVTDGDLDGTGIDKIRMKIYNKNNGSIIYDNQFGASDAVLPTQAVGSDTRIVISGTNAGLTQSNTLTRHAEMETTEAKTLKDLNVIAYPNPSTNSFSITLQSNAKDKITMQVVDMYGRIIETRNVSANSTVKFGDKYRPGTYFVRVIQSKENKEIKLIKLPD